MSRRTWQREHSVQLAKARKSWRNQGARMSPAATCPCRMAVPLTEYEKKDPQQAALALRFIEELGEFQQVTVGTRTFRVSRHCIALHGITGLLIDHYGFEEVTGG